MNLNCNYIKNKYMNPMSRIYVKVKNSVYCCPIFLKVMYFYDGRWITKTSNIVSYGESARVDYERSSLNRDLTIFKRIGSKDTFIYNTLITVDIPICFEVTGTAIHTFINKVEC